MGKSFKNVFKAAFALPLAVNKVALQATNKAGAMLGINKTKKASSTDASYADALGSLAKEREENSKKRVRLYATEHGELGEEVNDVGISGNRGKIFS